MNLYIDNFIKKSFEEDFGLFGDITTDNLFEDSSLSKGEFNFREEAVLSGIDIVKRVFEILDERVEFIKLKNDGEVVKSGEVVATIEGSTKAILKGERIALNIMQRLSGIASETKKYVDIIKEYDCRVADTRKTTPLFRFFEKYAVKCGGGSNHRFGLFDAAMIKDNHIVAMGSIENAVKKLKEALPHTTKIEVEVEDLKGAKEALLSGADIIMLDNMRGEELKESVNYLKGKVIIEASGNINFETIEEIARSGVDVISTGSIIYSAQNIDIGLDFMD